MPRRKISFIQGHYYHIYNRGAGRQPIFRESENYLYLLRLLKRVLVDLQISMIAYCLLPNHYHWLVRQDGETAVNQLPKRVFGSYTQAFNKKYQRTGTLFEGPFKAKYVNNGAYLYQLCAYIHRNPVKHGLADSLEAWPFSNYPEWIGIRAGTLIDRNFILSHFPNGQQYEEFVRDCIFQEAVSFLEDES
ncbi:MAG: transposase [Chloroflexota bacterium]